jgi:hypothetical protein
VPNDDDDDDGLTCIANMGRSTSCNSLHGEECGRVRKMEKECQMNDTYHSPRCELDAWG